MTMSQPQHAQPLPSVRVPLTRKSLAWIVGLVLIVAGGTAAIVTYDDGGSTSSVPVSRSLGGPNETARGSSVASAVGAQPLPSVGGPDETARGQSVASASR
jgi:hypothetical protein